MSYTVEYWGALGFLQLLVGYDKCGVRLKRNVKGCPKEVRGLFECKK